MMGIEIERIQPYVTLRLARIAGRELRAVPRRVLEDAVKILDISGAQTDDIESIEQTGLSVSLLHYQLEDIPSWYAGDDLADVNNHLLLIARKNRFLAIYTSDKAARGKLARRFGAETEDYPGLAVLEDPDPEVMNAAFGHGTARTLWLSGIHRRTPHKADAKSLSGIDLESALDPIGDQSYYFTAARSQLQLPALEQEAATVGFSPQGCNVWIGPSTEWDDFLIKIRVLLTRMIGGEARPDSEPLPVLATPATDESRIQTAYDMTVIAPELVAQEEFGAEEARRAAERWAYQTTFDVEPASAGPNFTAHVLQNNNVRGQLQVELELDGRGGADLNVVAESDEPVMKEAAQALKRWSKVRYESGHTYSDGRVYNVRHRDRAFGEWLPITFPEAVDIGREKPATDDHGTALAERIASEDDDSLFGWIAETWPPEHSRRDDSWLACDDGGGEVADFIFVDPDHPGGAEISLIHVKASGKDDPGRQLSVADFEIVVGQAVKNLRHLDHANLAEELERGKEKQIAAATWRGHERVGDREDLIAAVRGLGADYRRRVVILQPRVTSRELNFVRDPENRAERKQRVRRMEQLDTLLIEAQGDCQRLGAAFEVTCHNL